MPIAANKLGSVHRSECPDQPLRSGAGTRGTSPSDHMSGPSAPHTGTLVSSRTFLLKMANSPADAGTLQAQRGGCPVRGLPRVHAACPLHSATCISKRHVASNAAHRCGGLESVVQSPQRLCELLGLHLGAGFSGGRSRRSTVRPARAVDWHVFAAARAIVVLRGAAVELG